MSDRIGITVPGVGYRIYLSSVPPAVRIGAGRRRRQHVLNHLRNLTAGCRQRAHRRGGIRAAAPPTVRLTGPIFKCATDVWMARPGKKFLQHPYGIVQIKGIHRSDGEMNFPLQQRPQFVPMRFEVMA